MYKLLKPILPNTEINVVLRIADNACIPYITDNTDYQNFKAQINDESEQLETIDGVLMTPEEAKAYVATLP